MFHFAGLALSVCFADTLPPFGTCVPPPPAGGVFQRERLWQSAKSAVTVRGSLWISWCEDDGEVVQSSTCVIPLTRKASFVQPLRRLRRQLSWQESPWQRGFVFDETDLRLLENVTECQSLSLWERCLRSRRRGQGCCQRARHTAIRTLLVRAIVSQRRWSNFTGLVLSGADAPAPPKWEPLAKRCRFAEID